MFRLIARELAPSGRDGTHRAFTTLTLAICLGSIPRLGIAQVPVRSISTLEELRRELAPKDDVSVVKASGDLIAGRLVRLGDVNLEIRTRPSPGNAPSTLTVPLIDVRAVERRPDSPKNGAIIGAAIGAGISLGMFSWALAVDRNEIDEWGRGYLMGGVLTTGIGALLGWALDYGHSKPWIRIELPPAGLAVRSQLTF